MYITFERFAKMATSQDYLVCTFKGRQFEGGEIPLYLKNKVSSSVEQCGDTIITFKPDVAQSEVRTFFRQILDVMKDTNKTTTIGLNPGYYPRIVKHFTGSMKIYNSPETGETVLEVSSKSYTYENLINIVEALKIFLEDLPRGVNTNYKNEPPVFNLPEDIVEIEEKQIFPIANPVGVKKAVPVPIVEEPVVDETVDQEPVKETVNELVVIEKENSDEPTLAPDNSYDVDEEDTPVSADAPPVIVNEMPMVLPTFIPVNGFLCEFNSRTNQVNVHIGNKPVWLTLPKGNY